MTELSLCSGVLDRRVTRGNAGADYPGDSGREVEKHPQHGHQSRPAVARQCLSSLGTHRRGTGVQGSTGGQTGTTTSRR